MLSMRMSKMHQVLEVLLQNVCDISLLARCATLSHQCKQSVQDATRANLAALTTSCKVQPHAAEQTLQRLTWLCSTAGSAAVNTHEAGCGILHVLASVEPHMDQPISYYITQIGLKLTDALVTYLARHHVKYVKEILQECDTSCVNGLYLTFATTQDHEPPATAQALLPAVTAELLPDLLRITCSQGYRATTGMLLKRDKECLHVLDAPTAGASGSKSRCTDADQAQQHAAQATALITALLLERIKAGDQTLVHRLCRTDAARQLGVLAVTQLLYTAVFSCDAQMDDDSLPCPVAEIAALPAAKKISTNSIAAMLHHSIRHKDASRAAPLLRLPGAKQVQSRHLCAMMTDAARAGLTDMMWELGKLADGRQLDSADVKGLLKAFLRNSDPYDCFTDALPDFGSLKPGRHLTPDNVLELFEECLADPLFSASECCEVSTLMPAADQISDIPRFVKCLKTAAEVSEGFDLLEDAFIKLPAIHQVQSVDWVDILQACLANGGIANSVLALPAVQHLQADHLLQLLHTALDKCPRDLPALVALPAAQQLPVAAVRELLLQLMQAAAQPQPDWDLDDKDADGDLDDKDAIVNACRQVLELPQAKELPVPSVLKLLHVAWAEGLALVAAAILEQLPQVQQAAELEQGLSGERLVKGVLAACKRCAVADFAAMARDADVLKQVLSVADTEALLIGLLSIPPSYDWEVTGILKWMVTEQLPQLPAYQQVGSHAVLDALKVCVSTPPDKAKEYHHMLSAFGYIGSIAALPSAAALTAEQVLPLLHQLYDLKGCSTLAAWKGLLGLPGLQQLDPEGIAGLLGRVWKSEDAFSIANLLLAHPAAAGIGPDALYGLMEQYILCGNVTAPEMFLHLPAAKQLQAGQAASLLQLAMQYDYSSICDVLCTLPCAVAGTDAELQMLVHTWRGFGEPNQITVSNWCDCPLCQQHMQG